MSDTDNRIATVRPVEEHEATGKVAEIFADIRRTKNINFVPRFWQVIATNPAQLELVWTSLKTLMHPEAVGRTARLDPSTREIIALAVSATNGCPYCINSHTAALRKLAQIPKHSARSWPSWGSSTYRMVLVGQRHRQLHENGVPV